MTQICKWLVLTPASMIWCMQPAMIICLTLVNIFGILLRKDALTNVQCCMQTKCNQKSHHPYLMLKRNWQSIIPDSYPDKPNSYFKERRLNLDIFYQFYGQFIYRARRWRTFKKDQQSIASLINNFKGMRKKSKTLVLAYGSWAKCSTKLPIKGMAPCIGIGLRRRLAKEFIVADVPEHYTSQTCSKCFGKCGPFHELKVLQRSSIANVAQQIYPSMLMYPSITHHKLVQDVLESAARSMNWKSYSDLRSLTSRRRRKKMYQRRRRKESITIANTILFVETSAVIFAKKNAECGVSDLWSL